VTSRATLHVVVRGRVQGVGFRWFVREAARELKLGGWVKNRPDGTVEVLACGEEAAIAELRTRLEKGPAGAAVASIDAEANDAGAVEAGMAFIILR
jgi:acylphosphatase